MSTDFEVALIEGPEWDHSWRWSNVDRRRKISSFRLLYRNSNQWMKRRNFHPDCPNHVNGLPELSNHWLDHDWSSQLSSVHIQKQPRPFHQRERLRRIGDSEEGGSDYSRFTSREIMQHYMHKFSAVFSFFPFFLTVEWLLSMLETSSPIQTNLFRSTTLSLLLFPSCPKRVLLVREVAMDYRLSSQGELCHLMEMSHV